MNKYFKTLKKSLPLLALSAVVFLIPMQVKAQDATTTTSTLQTIVSPIVNQLLTPSTTATTPYLQQMEQQFLQNHPNFQQQYPAAYNQLINNPQAFFSRQNYQGNWQNYQNLSGETIQQRVQQFLQNHPNFQQQHPAAYNQLINNPQAFFADMHQREYGQNNQQGYRRHRRFQSY